MQDPPYRTEMQEMTAMTDPVFTASVDYATRPMSLEERRNAILRFVEVYNELRAGSIERPFYLGYARSVSTLPPEDVEPLFLELADAKADLDEWSAAADLGRAHEWQRDHNLSPSDTTVGTRLASTVEALLSRLVGGVA